jgi:uncharacterized protein Yka (UPF0111/DUF47 family)
MLSFIKKYILPKEIDFFDAMKNHSDAIREIVFDLQRCFIYEDKDACQKILNDESNSKEIKRENMKNLLNTFITPIDRESIYRVTMELDWIAISVRHLILEVNSYKIENLKEYNLLFHSLVDMAKRLNSGFLELKNENAKDVGLICEDVRELYDKAIGEYILYMSELSKDRDIKKIFTHKEILFQIRDIAKRFHLCANSLEDIVAKVV